MLTDKLKQQIQDAYSKFLENKNLLSRYGQKLMIAEIAKTLGNIELDDENVRIGSQHLNRVLVRAMNDGNSQGVALSPQRSVHAMIALKAIKSLAEIVGENSIAGTPLIDAMKYPDRLIRYESAIALAGGLPQKAFPGQERVVMLLAEALAQTGTPGVLIFANTPADVIAASQALKGFRTAGGTNADQVIAESAQLPSVDAILISEDVNPDQLRRLLQTASSSPRLDFAAKVVMVKSKNSDWFRAALTDQKLSATIASPASADILIQGINVARTRAGGLAMDAKTATDYALRSAAVMSKLAISRGQVLDIMPAEPTLLGSLGDPRVDLAKASAGVAAYLDSSKTQVAIGDRAIDEKTPDDVKIVLYKALAANVKFYGNRLDETRIDSLRKAASSEKSPEVKSAAAEGLGSLNLTTEQVKPLILNRPDNATP